MPSNLFFIPQMQVFRALTKVSVYDILTNNFNVNPSQKLKSEHCVPVKQFFEECNFFYETSIDNNKMSVQRIKYWFDIVILLIQLFNLIKCIFYIFWDEEDPIIRLYGGDLTNFFGLNTRFIAVPQAGVSLYVLSEFLLYYYSSVNLNWLATLNSIEGKQSFVSSKIFIEKSAKNLIRFSLLLIISCIMPNYITFFVCLIVFLYFPFVKLSLKLFILLAVPWAFTVVIWAYHLISYGLASVIILIPSYYYEMRLNQLDLFVKFQLKLKNFSRINQQVSKLLVDYEEVINEINQFNKFASKVIFLFTFFCCSTLVFLLYNIIYVKIDWLLYSFYGMFAADVTFVISLLLICAVRLSRRIDRNRRNLIKLNYIQNLQIKNRIKVSFDMKISINQIVF